VERKVDVVGQMILACIPIIATPLYASYRVKKLKKGILLLIAIIAIIMVFYIISYYLDKEDYLSNWVIPLLIEILMPVYFVRKWTIEYNEKLSSL